jgi:hypothetical protein
VLVDPLIAPITIIGFASSTIVLFPLPKGISCTEPICRSLDYLALVAIKLLDSLATFFASVEGTYVNFGPPSSLTVFLYYASLACLFSALHARRLRLVTMMILDASNALLLYRPSLDRPVASIRRNSMTFVGTDRKAIQFGLDDTVSNKFTAYEGVKLKSHLNSMTDFEAPSCFRLANHKSQIDFIVFKASQLAAANPHGLMPPRASQSPTIHDKNCPLILTICSDSMCNDSPPQEDPTQPAKHRTHKKRSPLSTDSVNALQQHLHADYILMLQTHFSNHRRQFKEPIPEQEQISPTYNIAGEELTPEEALPFSIECDRGTEARLFKRLP